VVNESLGRTAGDELVRLAALRLVGCVRATDLVARATTSRHQHLVSRFDGDEFVLLLTKLVDVEATAAVAKRVRNALARPFELDGQEIFVSANIGIGVFSHDGETAEQLLRNAHLAAQHAKETPSEGCQFYTDSLNDAARARLTLEADLRRAVERDEFELHYQPQFRVVDDTIVGAEALVRWRHPEQGLVSPATFIPLCEEIGLIHEVGAWVLESACRQARRWQQEYDPHFRISVNISNRQFEGNRLTPAIRGLLEETGIAPSTLELELTVCVILGADDDDLIQLAELRRLGLKLAIDDFGTGFSSLSYLTRFPVDALKIDRSFIREVPGRQRQESLARAIIAMGQSLGLRVVAEGVETEDQLAFLRELHCEEQQGFLMGRPVTAREFELRLAAVRSEVRSRAS
jgi:diguanylate cyclase (GGDEF)-like protein